MSGPTVSRPATASSEVGADSTQVDATPISTYVIIGVLTGFLAGLFGVGGGILIVPALVMAAHMPQRLAHGTSLAAVLPISIASMTTYAIHGHVNWAVALFLSIGAVAGAVLGTKLLNLLPTRVLAITFALFLLASAVRLYIATEPGRAAGLTTWGAIALIGVGVLTGVMAGLLGVGGGIVMVPAMIILFHVPPVVAKGTSAAVTIPTSIMGTWRNRKNRNANLRAAVPIGLAGIVTAAIGGTIADKMSASLSNFLFAMLLTIVALRMLWQVYSEYTRKAPAH